MATKESVDKTALNNVPDAILDPMENSASKSKKIFSQAKHGPSIFPQPVSKGAAIVFCSLFIAGAAVLFAIFTSITNMLNYSDTAEYTITESALEKDDYVIVWEDSVLEKKIRLITGITDRDIMHSDVFSITSLDLSNCPGASEETKILNINALRNFANLKELNLSHNQISDITALEELTNLTKLYMDDNQICDIDALANLTRLTRLSLSYNQLCDISVLNNLTELRWLNLDCNDQLKDISSLKSLNKLTELHLANNQIYDIGTLESLTNLTLLNLFNNKVSDVSALKALTNLRWLNLCDNKILNYTPVEELDIQYLYKSE